MSKKPQISVRRPPKPAPEPDQEVMERFIQGGDSAKKDSGRQGVLPAALPIETEEKKADEGAEVATKRATSSRKATTAKKKRGRPAKLKAEITFASGDVRIRRTCYLPKEIDKALRMRAVEEGVKVNDLIIDAVCRLLDG